MTRRVSKTGRVYTEGSHAILDGYPNRCAGCDKRIRITVDPFLWFETLADGRKLSWHTGCRPGPAGDARPPPP